MSQAGFEFAMVTDVPRVVWLAVLLEDREVHDVSTSVAVARVLLDRVSAELVETAPSGPDAVELWPCVFAALLDPFVLDGFEDALAMADLAHACCPCASSFRNRRRRSARTSAIAS